MRDTVSTVKSFGQFLSTVKWKPIASLSHFNPQGNFIISSDPRGGSNWIAEAIAQLPKTVILLEPLHLGRPSRFRELGFYWRQYIPENANWEEARHAFEQVFRGKVLNDGTCARSSYLDFLRAERMVIKFCRAKALLPWLTQNFTFTYTPINFIRHPCAVVASQRQYGAEGWKNDTYSGFILPDCPYNEFYTQHTKFLSSLTTKEEELIAIWCITNLVSLQNPRNNKDWITVHYEQLLLDPEKELQRIFQRWGLSIPQGIWDQLQKPSATTKDATFQKGNEEQLGKWKSFFNQEQLARMKNVLEYFQIDLYTIDNIIAHETR